LVASSMRARTTELWVIMCNLLGLFVTQTDMFV
jgi:hypothetical protein